MGLVSPGRGPSWGTEVSNEPGKQVWLSGRPAHRRAPLERFSVNGAEFEYETCGAGEPLVLIHGVIIGDACAPLLAEAQLTSRYQVAHYHRRGHIGSPAHRGAFSIADQASDALAVIRHVAGGRAHVAGHSYGGTIALQLALDAPESVHSLSLLEAGAGPGGPAADAVAPIRAAYEAGDKAGSMDAFLALAIGPGYREIIDKTLPSGWFEQSAADLDTLFQVEGPSLREWEFTADHASRVHQPVLLVVGAQSPPYRMENHALLQQWLPQAEPFVLPGAAHGLQMENPSGMAAALVSFLASHPMPVSTPA